MLCFSKLPQTFNHPCKSSCSSPCCPCLKDRYKGTDSLLHLRWSTFLTPCSDQQGCSTFPSHPRELPRPRYLNFGSSLLWVCENQGVKLSGDRSHPTQCWWGDSAPGGTPALAGAASSTARTSAHRRHLHPRSSRPSVPAHAQLIRAAGISPAARSGAGPRRPPTRAGSTAQHRSMTPAPGEAPTGAARADTQEARPPPAISPRPPAPQAGPSLT